MTKVLIDCGRIRNDRVGLGEVAVQFAAALWRLAGSRDSQDAGDLSFLFLTHPRFHAFAAAAQKQGMPHITGKFSLANKIIRLWNKNVFAYSYHETDHAVRHALHRMHLDIPAADKKPLVLTLHDMHFMHQSRRGAARAIARQKRSVARADVVCFISKYAREVTAEHINLSGKETRIIYNGTNKPANPARPSWFKDSMRPFLLTIGQIEKHKRFHLLPPMMRHLPGMSLIICGKRKSGAELLDGAITQARNAKPAGKGIMHTPGLISENEKAYLLQECAAFVFPSEREGFGMPVIEAFHYGKPVFCFSNTALPEVGGEHAHYWQSEQPRDMAQFVEQHVEADNAAAALARQAWAEKFSWHESARAYISLYHELAAR